MCKCVIIGCGAGAMVSNKEWVERVKSMGPPKHNTHIPTNNNNNSCEDSSAHSSFVWV